MLVDRTNNKVVNANVIWHEDPNNQRAGYWLAVEPSKSAWATMDKIQQFVGTELAKEKITTWAPYPHHLSHASVFLGFTEKTTAAEKIAIMRRISEKISRLPKFEINFNMKDATIKRGPGNYVTLHFNSPELISLNEKAREAIAEAIEAGEFDRTHLYTNGTGKDKLDFNISPHFTLGILDIKDSPDIEWKNKHIDIKRFANKEHREEFEKRFDLKKNHEFKDLTCKFSVANMDLLATDTAKESVQNKVYRIFASVGLGKPSSLQATEQTSQLGDFASVFSQLKIHQEQPTADYKESIRTKVYEVLRRQISVDIKADFDENRKPTIHVGFIYESDARDFLQTLGISGNIWKSNTGYLVRLGEVRCQHIFGLEKGNQIYRKAAEALDTKSHMLNRVEAEKRCIERLRQITRDPNFNFSIDSSAQSSLKIRFWENDQARLNLYRHFKDALGSCMTLSFTNEYSNGKCINATSFDEIDFQVMFGDHEGTRIFNALR